MDVAAAYKADRAGLLEALRHVLTDEDIAALRAPRPRPPVPDIAAGTCGLGDLMI